jgi:hypothetical protein
MHAGGMKIHIVINRACSIFVPVLLTLLLGAADGATWTKTYGGFNAEYWGLIRQTEDDGYILGGYSASFGSGGYDIWVVKLNGDGSIAWQKSYGGQEQDSINSIDQTSDGGYIVAGTSLSFAQGEYAAWLLKLDPNGNVQWQKSYGGNVEDWINSVQQTPDGGYIAAGGTSSSGAGKYDAWILKLDSNGSVQWQKTYGGNDDDWINKIQCTADGGYIAAGMTKSFGEGDQDIWLLKLESSGGIEWEKTYGGTGTDAALSIQQTSDLGYVAAGYTVSFGAGKQDVWVLKLASDGVPEWQRALGGQEDDMVYSIQQTLDGGYVAAGHTSSFGAGSNDQWLLKLDSGGNIDWQKTFGGGNSEHAYSAEQTLDGGYILSGITDSFGIRGYDLWVLKLDGNGNLFGCPMEGTSNAVVTDTTATGKPSAAIVKNTSVSPSVTEATVADTTAMPITQCQPAISVKPDSVEFGSVKVGNYSQEVVGIFNAGSENIIIGTLTIQGADASQFHLDVDCSGQTLVPASFCNTYVAFYPTSEGTKNGVLSIPSSAASQGTLNVSLTGKGVTSSGISLVSPSDMAPADVCSLYDSYSFAWDETEYFKSHEIQFSLAEDFGQVRVKYKTATPWAKAPLKVWKKILRLPENDDVETPIFWRVVGIRSDKTQVFSDVFSVLVAPRSPVGVPTITPTSRNALPTLSWKHFCSTKFKVTFWNGDTGRKTSVSYILKNPMEIGDLFTKELTAKQWGSIRKLVGDEAGRTIFWSVKSWDALKRHSETETMSFVLQD